LLLSEQQNDGQPHQQYRRQGDDQLASPARFGGMLLSSPLLLLGLSLCVPPRKAPCHLPGPSCDELPD
jgi:hypothetical protein